MKLYLLFIKRHATKPGGVEVSDKLYTPASIHAGRAHTTHWTVSVVNPRDGSEGDTSSI
jgi:hypothetical protein